MAAWSNDIANESQSLGKRITSGGIALSLARIATQALGAVSALTVPRWLGPEEMGVFAVAMLALGAIEAFTQSGFASAFIQRKTDYEKYLLPVRTFNALRGFFLGCVIFLSAPHVAQWMDAPRSASVLRVMALIPVLDGLMPMIWTLASKRLRFGYAAKFNVCMTALNLAVTIPLAYHLMSVWALVWGMLASSLVGVVVSSLLDQEGRGFTLDWRPLRDLHRFGFWIFLTAIASYVYVNGGNWLIGRLLDLQTLAVYTLAFRSCTMFTGEAAKIINGMMFPVFSLIQDDLPRLRTGFRKSFGILAMIIGGVGAFFCVASRDYFAIVLGDKWGAYTELFNSLLPWLTLWGVCSAFAGAQSGIFQALGKPNWWLYTVLIMCAAMLVLIGPAVHLWGAVGVAGILGGVATIMQLARYAILSRMLHLRFHQVAGHVLLPAAGGVLSVALATAARGYVKSQAWGQAAAAVTIVTSVYLATLLVFGRYMYPNPVVLIGQVKKAALDRFKTVMT